MHGARAVRALCEKKAILDPFSPVAKVITVFPDIGLPQIPTQSKKPR